MLKTKTARDPAYVKRGLVTVEIEDRAGGLYRIGEPPPPVVVPVPAWQVRRREGHAWAWEGGNCSRCGEAASYQSELFGGERFE